MRRIRHFIEGPLVPGAIVMLPEHALGHLVRVLRLGVGDGFVLFNGDGADYQAKLLSIGKRSAEAIVGERVVIDNESPLHITLAQGVARGEKMDLILQKAVELGVHGIAPIITERTEVRLDAERSEKRMQHWRGVMAAACEQCGRARLPVLHAPEPLPVFAAAQRSARRLILDPNGGKSIADLSLQQEDSLCLLIGPEGGLSERDLAALHAARFEGLRLGPRVLRTETAGIAAIAALNAVYGDWR